MLSMKKIFSKKSMGDTPGKKFENFFFDKRVSNFIPITAAFHRDYESDIFRFKSMIKEGKNGEIPTRWGMNRP